MTAQKTVRRKRREKSEYYFDYSLLFIVLFLLGFGLIMVYSASSYEAFDDYGDAAFYMKKQLIANLMGLAAMVVVAMIPYQFWKRFAVVGYVVSAILIVLVKTPLGRGQGGRGGHGGRRGRGSVHIGIQPPRHQPVEPGRRRGEQQQREDEQQSVQTNLFQGPAVVGAGDPSAGKDLFGPGCRIRGEGQGLAAGQQPPPFLRRLRRLQGQHQDGLFQGQGRFDLAAAVGRGKGRPG